MWKCMENMLKIFSLSETDSNICDLIALSNQSY